MASNKDADDERPGGLLSAHRPLEETDQVDPSDYLDLRGTPPAKHRKAEGPHSGGSHPVRDKLLARASGHLAAEPNEPPASDFPRFSSLDESPNQDTDDDYEYAKQRRSAPRGDTTGRKRLSQGSATILTAMGGLIAGAAIYAMLQTLPFAEEAEDTASADAADSANAPIGAVLARPAQPKLVGPWRIAQAKMTPDRRRVTGKIGKKAFLIAVQDAGVPLKESYRLLIAYKGLRNLDRCKSSHRFSALLDRPRQRLLAFEYIVNDEEIYQARENKEGLLRASKLDMKIGRERVQGAIAVSKQGFLLSSQAAGFEEGLSPVLSRALEGRYSLGDIQAGDRFRIIAQEVTVLGQFSRYSGIEAIEYLPVGEKALRLYYFRGTVSKGYFDARGRAPGQGGWRKPIPDAPRTSKFNPRRLHPIKKIIMPHNGTDFGAPTGTPIGASSSGVISFIGNAGPSGNLVKIQHSAGIETGYAHLSRFASGLKVGDRVARMQVVGYCGSTGRSTGPHLHFSAKRDGKYIDPESLKLDALTMLGPKERAMLSEVRSRYDRLLDVIQLPEAVAVAPPPAASAPIVVDDAPHFERGASPTASPDLPSVNVAPPAAPKLAPTATATAARPTSASAAATRRDYSTLYLTDRELLRSQSQQDDGESDE